MSSPSVKINDPFFIPVLVLDVDDTLYAEGEFVRSALRAAGANARAVLGVAGLVETAVRLFEAGRRGDLFQATWAELKAVPVTAEQVAGLVRVYREHRPEILSWYADAEAFVRGYRAGGGRLAVISDGYLPTQRHKVEALGLLELASPVVLSEELGREHWKPSPRPYQAVMDAFAPGTSFVYIGDNPLKDFVSAKELGWATVRVRRRGGEHSFKEPPDARHAADIEVPDFRLLATQWQIICQIAHDRARNGGLPHA